MTASPKTERGHGHVRPKALPAGQWDGRASRRRDPLMIARGAQRQLLEASRHVGLSLIDAYEPGVLAYADYEETVAAVGGDPRAPRSPRAR